MRPLLPHVMALAAMGVVVGLAASSGSFGSAWRLAGWGILLLSIAWAVSLFVAPQDVRAWRSGAAGEEETGRRLDMLEPAGFCVIHDRLMPRSRANIDHIVVGPPGVFVVETKNYPGKRVRVYRGELWVAGRRKTRFVDQAKRQAGAVAHIVWPVPVTPLIVFHQADFGWGWQPIRLDGVRIVGPNELLRVVRKAPQQLSAGEVSDLARRIDRTLRPAS